MSEGVRGNAEKISVNQGRCPRRDKIDIGNPVSLLENKLNTEMTRA